MSALFQDPSCMEWWLPNSENYTPIVRAIRSFVESRTTQAIDVPQATKDLSDIKGIFANMKLDDGNDNGQKKDTSMDGLLLQLNSSAREERNDNVDGVVKVEGGWGGEGEEGGWGDVGGDDGGMQSSHGLWIQEQEGHHPNYDDYA